MDRVHPGGLGGTYGGNPIACAAALATLDTMEELDLCGAARRIEAVMLPRLRELAERYPMIGDVRGRGAMLAVEIVTDRDAAATGGREPDPLATAAVARACHDAGLLVLTCGTYGNVLRFLPPLVIPDRLVEQGMAVLDRAFAATVEEGRGPNVPPVEASSS
jgi:4-aminobutyrate aminotransferase / (S)-3-amino-2-methylpropionate transaminase / 5-aminovalerate transaminase